jgi:hypothetical protein
MEGGITPLEFMLNIMRTEPDSDIEDSRILQALLEMRFEAAKAAAPYIHPKLAAVELSGGVGVDLSIADQIKQAHEQRKLG